MQISKTLLVVCVTAACVGPLSLQAADSEAQAKAREALEKKMSELQDQPLPDEAASATTPNSQETNPVPAPAPEIKPLPAPAPASPLASPAPPVSPSFEPLAPTPAAAIKPAEQPAPMMPVESEAAAKAREALRQKMLELDAQQPAEVVAPSNPPISVKPLPPVKLPPVKKDEPKSQAASANVVPQPTPAAPPVDSEATAKAREAISQKMKELDAQELVETFAPSNPPVAVKAPPAVKPVVSRDQQKAQDQAAAEARKAEAAAQAQARKAAAEKAKIEAEEKRILERAAKAKTPVFPPMEAPPIPSWLSAEKAIRLQELTSKYMKDELTPEQYHTERAKILAEP